MQKCYGIKLTGEIHDIGFRILIEDITVKMVCCGENGVISDFFEDVRIKADRKGIIFDIADKKELPVDIPLPEKFIRLYTDELADISRKLDVGNEILRYIKNDTSALPQINVMLGSFVIEQREQNQWLKNHSIKMDEHLIKINENNQWMKEHNQRLEKILEKISEK